MSDELKCPICGKPTAHIYGNYNKYGLCPEHSLQQKNGEIEQCPDCGKWHDSNEECECKNNSNTKTNNICIICGEKTNNKYICNECWKDIDNHFETLDKNNTYIKLRDYYYNLKNYIYRLDTTDESILQNYLTKLYAIASLSKKLYERNDLYNKVIDDIHDIKEKKQKKQELSISENEKIEREINIAGVNRTEDGHFVKSELEVDIDDILYGLRLCHVYEKKVSKILERTVICDWYIPVIQNHGVYIELWGIDNNKKYSINKEEKRALYKKYNLPLIEIEKDEIRGDSRGLADRIESEFEKFKQELKSKY